MRLRTVLLLGLLLRLMVATQPPLLSPDLWRYRWDGAALLSGINPYAAAPSDPRLQHLRDDSFQRIEHRDVRSVYPPFAQLLFAIWTALGGSVVVWRMLILLLEATAAVLLFRLSRSAAFLYATSPLVILEGLWSGHLDVIAASLLVAACFVAPRRAAASGVLLALAAGIKIIPLAAAPALARLAGRRFLIVVALVLAIPLAIFAAAGGVMTGLSEYSLRWSFNSPLFAAARSAVELLRLDLALKSIWTAVKDLLQLESVSPVVYRYLHPDLIARGILALTFLAAILVILRRTRSTLAAAAHAVGLLILCSPTIHPWYWLSLLPLALALRNWFWITLAISSPVSYLLYDGAVGQGSIFVASYLPALVVGGAQLLSCFRARDISRWMAFRGDSPS